MSKIANTFVKLSTKQLDQKYLFIQNYKKANNAAEGSNVDANSNVATKNVATMMSELNKDINIQIKRYCVSKEIEKMWGKELADEYNRQIEAHEIYVHDESAIYPYCVSITMYPFLLNGLKGLGGDSIAPKHLISFCGSFINLCFAISSQFCGALATVEFLMYFDYFARKDFGDNYLETNKKDIENAFQQVVYSLNQPAAARGYQSIFWNISIFDKYYLESLFGELVFPDFTKPNFETITKLQKFFMNWFNEERRKALLTFPVVTAAMVVDKNGPKDEEFLDMCAEQDSRGNSFFKYESDSVDSLASCCRLRNELQENTFSYSLGAGGTQSGSLNVITINMNRLVQNAHKDTSIKLEDYLRDQVQKVHKYQLATKEFFKGFMEANMLDSYREGFIDINKQFLTIGINGLLESAEYLGLEANNNDKYKEYISKILKVIYYENKEAKKKYGILFNTEMVPAENLGVKNYNWDKEDGYVVPQDRNCYNSYLYKVEDIDIDPIDKFFLHGKDNLKYLDGGSALHLNLEEYPTKEAYKKLYKIASKTGCNYWTTNVAITCCEEKDCGYIDKRTLDHCSKCGSKNISHATRVIGYLRKIRNFSPERQKEADKRFYAKI